MKVTDTSTQKEAVAYVRSASSDSQVGGQEARHFKTVRQHKPKPRAIYYDRGLGPKPRRPG